ncbi:hypothetical protein FA95DRAFT_1457055, partial [Auriscalpium vulgare]
PPAFSEHPLIRKAYFTAYLQGTFHRATHEAIKLGLDSAYESLVSLRRQTGIEIEGLDSMARTLPTVERRLRVNADPYIVYKFLCPQCWCVYNASVLSELDGPECMTDNCSGILYTIRELTGGRTKRIPRKVLPTCPIIPMIQRFLMRPGKYDEYQHWRGEGDEPGPAQPIPPPANGFDAFPDPFKRMYDVYDGWGWRALMAGLERRRGGEWGMFDTTIRPGLRQRFVALPCGLVLMMNIDWFSPMGRNRKYSMGAVYITIFNNPRSKRFQPQETILAVAIPGGEGEPTTEQLNNVLESTVDDILRLYGGELLCTTSLTQLLQHSLGLLMRVHGKPGTHPIHALLNIEASDLPASRKAAGLRGVTSKIFMCVICYMPFNDLVSCDCYDPKKFIPREDNRYLKYALKHLETEDADERKKIEDSRGVRWSVLNKLPGFMPARDSPNDFMHGTYLGEIKHIVNVVLIRAGMMTARSRTDKPREKLDEALANVWWPKSLARIPKMIASTHKADEWRNLGNILPVLLYIAWQVDGEIPDGDAPHAREGTKAADAEDNMGELLRTRRRGHLSRQVDATASDIEENYELSPSRNYREHFENVLDYCVSTRIWGSQSITPDEARRAEAYHGRALRSWADMHCHLTPYFHLMMHHSPDIYRHGPSYSHWLF